MSLRLLIVGLCLAGLLIPSGAGAETKDRLDRRDKLLGWESVGRLETKTGYCTAVLIERDMVLTAAHCVPGADTGDIQTAGMVFRAGYRDRQQIAVREVLNAVVPPTYTQATQRRDDPVAIAHDVALLRLSSPIYEPGADPYAIDRLPPAGAEMTLASYGKGRIEALTLERGCILTTRYRGGVAGFNCDVTFGSSGAPVFARVGERLRIVSIISSVGNDGRGIDLAFGMELAQIVPELRQKLRNAALNTSVSLGARRISIGDRSATGARFLKP